MEEIVQILINKYNPVGMILYGSYADGTFDGQSDFDALLILRDGQRHHDTGLVRGVRLDVFCYGVQYIRDHTDPEEFVQIFHGKVLLDDTGLASGLMEEVRGYVREKALCSIPEKQETAAWCRKMVARARREDAEGLYRGHWLLTESLSIYCELRDLYYFGPKKTIHYLRNRDPYGYALFCRALCRREEMEPWLEYVQKDFMQEV